MTRWILNRAILLAAVAALASGCGDTANDPADSDVRDVAPDDDTNRSDTGDDAAPDDDTNQPDGGDDTDPLPPPWVDHWPELPDFEPVPCTGSLCFDPDDPDVTARHDGYRAWWRGILGLDELDPDDAEDAAELAHYEAYIEEQILLSARLYGACNYVEDEDGTIFSHCPDVFDGLAFCPHRWFMPHVGLVGGIPSRDGGPARCDEELITGPGRLCSPHGCAPGLVCSGGLTTDPDRDELAVGTRLVCLAPERCLELLAEQTDPWDRACLYPDLTSAVTGVPAAQDCDELAPGTCASNCACPDQGGEPVACAMLSEERPIGLCSPAPCESRTDCAAGEVCAWRANAPSWARELHLSWMGDSLIADEPILIGRCAEADACAAWRTQPGGVGTYDCSR